MKKVLTIARYCWLVVGIGSMLSLLMDNYITLDYTHIKTFAPLQLLVCFFAIPFAEKCHRTITFVIFFASWAIYAFCLAHQQEDAHLCIYGFILATNAVGIVQFTNKE